MIRMKRKGGASVPALAAAILVAVALSAPFSHGQTRSALETFTSKENGESWFVFDSSTLEFGLPNWNLDPEGGNPEIYGQFTTDNAFSLGVDDLGSGGAFVGDYAAAQIAGLRCAVYIADFTVVRSVDLYFFSGTDNRFYYSGDFSFTQNGWREIEVSFANDPWFYFEDDQWFEATITPEILKSVGETGICCIPDSGADGKVVGLDNFHLVPELVMPPMTISIDPPDSIACSFPRLDGQIYSVFASSDLASWSVLSSHANLLGNTPYVFAEPLSGDGHFRIETEPFEIVIPDIEG